jgi:putative ABC transport system ATP-binding protein
MSKNAATDHSIRAQQLTRVFPIGNTPFVALDRIELSLPRAGFVAVVGRSGCGKSTLLNLLAGLDRPTSGSIEIFGTRLETLDEDQLSQWRGRNVGVVFQSFQLLPTLTVAENVALPMDLCGTARPSEARERAMVLLRDVGILDQADKLPLELSGGQQQRAAIARALANDPPLIVADEPTGNLDSATSAQVLAILADLARRGRTVLMVTHDAKLTARADRTVRMSDGRVVEVVLTGEHADA